MNFAPTHVAPAKPKQSTRRPPKSFEGSAASGAQRLVAQLWFEGWVSFDFDHEQDWIREKPPAPA